MVEVDWFDLAACKDSELDFVPDSTEEQPPSPNKTISDIRQRRRICAKCPVVRECLIYAYDSPHSTRYGIYGGTTGIQRRTARKRSDAIEHLMKWFEGWKERDARYRSRPERLAK